MTQAQLAQGRYPLLAVRDVSVVFGGIIALNGVSFDMHQGQILGPIGPNGAGKTTLFNCLSRLYDPYAGTVELDGQSLLPMPRHAVARIGIGRTFQNLALFETMSVIDNVLCGAHCQSRGGFWADALRLPSARRDQARRHAEATELLELLELKEVAAKRV